MTVDTKKRGIGVFSDRENAEAALDKMKNSDFSMNQVSLVGKDTSQGQEMASNPNEIIPDKTTENLRKGALTGATLGSISGLLVGLSTLVIPGLGTIFVAGSHAIATGVLAGGFAGGVGGTWIGMVLGDAVSDDKANLYSDRLSQGNYLVIIDGNDEEIFRAESILKAQGILDWGVYSKP